MKTLRLALTLYLTLVALVIEALGQGRLSTYTRVGTVTLNDYVYLFQTNGTGNTNFAIKIIDLVSSVNALGMPVYPWSGPTNTLILSSNRWQFTATTGTLAVTNFSGAIVGYDVPSLLSVTNPFSTNVTFYITALGLTTDDGARSYVISNATKRKFSFNHDDMGYHLVSRLFY